MYFWLTRQTGKGNGLGWNESAHTLTSAPNLCAFLFSLNFENIIERLIKTQTDDSKSSCIKQNMRGK